MYLKVNRDFVFILLCFFAWKIFTSLVLYLSFGTFKLQQGFLGGEIVNYLTHPGFYPWANFDGVHYLAIAESGYKPLTYFFFPVYPLLVKYISMITKANLISTALIVSNISFILGLFGFHKLIKLNWKQELADMALITLLVFPTSFYFSAAYTESLFFCLSVWSAYFAVTNKWFQLLLTGLLTLATRLVGIAIIPLVLFESLKEFSRYRIKRGLLLSLVIPFSLLAYLFFVYRETGDPLDFMHNVNIFGQQRSGNIVLLPQVFYRYFFKVIPNINYNYFPIVFSTYLEILTAILFFILLIISIKKMPISYWFYFLVAYLAPTFSGSFSSFPRYVLIAFPGFIMLSLLLANKSSLVKTIYFVFSITFLIFAEMLFVRGYWIS